MPVAVITKNDLAHLYTVYIHAERRSFRQIYKPDEYFQIPVVVGLLAQGGKVVIIPITILSHPSRCLSVDRAARQNGK